MPPALMDLAPPAADARVAYGNHPSQFADFRRGEGAGARPLVIVIHGGFWRQRRTLVYAGHLCIALGREGFATANIEYRRSGEEGGGWPGTFADVCRAIALARERAHTFGADPARAVLLGHSAGGHLALLAAAETPGLRGAVSLGGVANLMRAHQLGLGDGAVEEFLGGTPEALPQAYLDADPAHGRTAVPRVLIHGTADEIVPCELSRDFPEPRRYVELPGVDHFGPIDPDSECWPVVVREIAALV
ncbi:MAG: alpha/beta hydrolase [Acidobacteriota bacterium]|nr:alpha/beta hydrolase [Acidobacteriota bacterium]